MPGLADVHAIHAADIRQEGGRNPECKHPAQPNPSTTRQGLFQHLRYLAFLDLACKSFFLHQPSFIRALEHIMRRSI